MTLILLLLFGIARGALSQSPPGDVVGKLCVGYQGWFTAQNDGSPVNIWVHWSTPNGERNSL